MAQHGTNAKGQRNAAVKLGQHSAKGVRAGELLSSASPFPEPHARRCSRGPQRALVSDEMRVFLKGVVVGPLASKYQRTYGGVAVPSWAKIADVLQKDEAFCTLAARNAQDAWVLGEEHEGAGKAGSAVADDKHAQHHQQQGEQALNTREYASKTRIE